jgi:membrane-bound ClpP family serine protease
MSEFFLSDAEMMARTFGTILGAASCCDVVSNERLDATAEKMKTVLSVTAGNGREERAAHEQFSAAVNAGRRAVREGEIQDWAAENALRQIKHDLDEAPLVLD